jgi:hypothetical protein
MPPVDYDADGDDEGMSGGGGTDTRRMTTRSARPAAIACTWPPHRAARPLPPQRDQAGLVECRATILNVVFSGFSGVEDTPARATAGPEGRCERAWDLRQAHACTPSGGVAGEWY